MRLSRTAWLWIMMLSAFAPAMLAQDTKAPIVQPLPYSHKQHLAQGLKCQFCHVEPGAGELMTFPVTDTCMSCHKTVAIDKPAIIKLAEYAKSKEEIPWVRVYKIPEWVDFSHKRHLQGGATCEQCHGQVSQRDVLFKEVNLNMATCLDCHRQKSVSVECDYCHDPR